MSNEGAGGTSGSVNAWSGTARGHAGPPGPSGSAWNGMTQRHGGRDSSSSGRCADDWLVRADSGSTQPSTHQTALTVTASNTAMAHALATGALYTTQGPTPSADLANRTQDRYPEPQCVHFAGTSSSILSSACCSRGQRPTCSYRSCAVLSKRSRTHRRRRRTMTTASAAARMSNGRVQSRLRLLI